MQLARVPRGSCGVLQQEEFAPELTVRVGVSRCKGAEVWELGGIQENASVWLGGGEKGKTLLEV